MPRVHYMGFEHIHSHITNSDINFQIFFKMVVASLIEMCLLFSFILYLNRFSGIDHHVLIWYMLILGMSLRNNLRKITLHFRLNDVILFAKKVSGQ